VEEARRGSGCCSPKDELSSWGGSPPRECFAKAAWESRAGMRFKRLGEVCVASARNIMPIQCLGAL